MLLLPPNVGRKDTRISPSDTLVPAVSFEGSLGMSGFRLSPQPIKVWRQAGSDGGVSHSCLLGSQRRQTSTEIASERRNIYLEAHGYLG